MLTSLERLNFMTPCHVCKQSNHVGLTYMYFLLRCWKYSCLKASTVRWNACATMYVFLWPRHEDCNVDRVMRLPTYPPRRIRSKRSSNAPLLKEVEFHDSLSCMQSVESCGIDLYVFSFYWDAKKICAYRLLPLSGMHAQQCMYF